MTGIVGFASLVISAVFSGAFVSGDRMARNLFSESKEDKKERLSLTNKILLIGLPNLIVAALVYFI